MRRLVAVVSILASGACSRQPSFTYEATPGTQVSAFRTAAFDPRDLAWLVEGQRPVRAEALKPQVRACLEAQGYQWVEPSEADLWVDVVALRPVKGEEGRGMAPSGHEGRGRGRSGGRRGNNGRDPDRGSTAQAGGSPASLDFAADQALTITVQLLARDPLQPLWTGSVYRPGQKKPAATGSAVTLPQLVQQLMSPVPASQAKGIR